MGKISGFARVMARTRFNEELNKPFIGKPYLKCGQGLGIWGYCFQLGGILGAKHRDKLDAFGHAFLGATGETGAVKRYFTELANLVTRRLINDSTTFVEYVQCEYSERIGYTGDAASFFLRHGMDKLQPEAAAGLAWQYANNGAAFGALCTDTFRKMFERSHRVVPKQEWDRARDAGLDLPAEQDFMSYKEIEEAENGVFMAYCQECCSELYAVLMP